MASERATGPPPAAASPSPAVNLALRPNHVTSAQCPRGGRRGTGSQGVIEILLDQRQRVREPLADIDSGTSALSRGLFLYLTVII